MPVIPRMPRYTDSGVSGSSWMAVNSSAEPCARSRQPYWCSTGVPSGSFSERDSTTRPTAPPVMVSFSANGGT